MYVHFISTPNIISIGLHRASYLTLTAARCKLLLHSETMNCTSSLFARGVSLLFWDSQSPVISLRPVVAHRVCLAQLEIVLGILRLNGGLGCYHFFC